MAEQDDRLETDFVIDLGDCLTNPFQLSIVCIVTFICRLIGTTVAYIIENHCAIPGIIDDRNDPTK